MSGLSVTIFALPRVFVNFLEFSEQNCAEVRVQHGAGARRGRSTWRRRSSARVFHLPRRAGEYGCHRVAPLLPAGGAGAAAAGAILKGWEKRPSAQRSIGVGERVAVQAYLVTTN